MRGSVLGGLWRPLAADERRTAYWQRHVLIGVLLSEVAAWAVFGYVLLTPTAAADDVVLLGLALAVVVASPVLLLLPLAAWVRDHRGALLFYAWSLVDTAVIAVAARRDGGEDSPLSSLLFLTLAFMATAYPPAGVVLMGAVMTVAYLVAVCLPGIGLAAVFVAVVMGAFTMTCALSSGNQWEAYDQQVLLLRTQETLAATDPLTGCLNRRAFLDRLSSAAATVPDDTRTVVALIDLDGFKHVNDTSGHAAGDAVLRSVASSLRAALREIDTVARLGGDEFAVLITGLGADEVDGMAERIRSSVAAAGVACGVTGSVGVTVAARGEDVHELLRRADAAMYAAKASGGDRVSAALR